MPDKVKTTEEIGKIKVDQVAIGSCTNSSFVDMMKVAKILKGKTVCPTVSLCIAPGSKQVLNMLAMNGALGDMIGGVAAFWSLPAVRVLVWVNPPTAAASLCVLLTGTLRAAAAQKTPVSTWYLRKWRQPPPSPVI